ncbi:hypothetical protein [Archangium lipolyticum]|uniref:hypothetical protein n=1 Tax=Archangium lipolyticum TaxID=2970465 RepID=UPI002149ED80|nr:hypothetical protein [Archangium lipolyticum]
MSDTMNGPAREKLEPAVVSKLETAGILVHDGRRLRSFFFDGRFLTAKDLTREQTYFLTRQADLGRSGGVGVVTGLHVKAGPDPRSLEISAGHGVTPSGEAVVIPKTLANVRLDDIPEIQRLDAAFGLAQIPRETARNRSGLYIVALRPVEYTANPVAQYPSTAGGARTAHDGDIIEATAITLLPYPDSQAGAGFESRRSRVAHEIFVRNGGMRPPVDALPIAMIALDHGVVRWIDTFLVRREVGSEQTDFLGFGQAPRALREAHLLQYQMHLQEVIQDRKQTNRGERFAASDHFFALPPAGPLPVAAVDKNLNEVFFPPEVDVELSVVPEDELGALLEESLFLSPIDLTRTGEELSSVSVLVLVPVPRREMDQALSTLLPSEKTGTMKLRATASGLVARRQPGEALRLLSIRKSALLPARATAPTLDAPHSLTAAAESTTSSAQTNLADASWSNLLSNATSLWYVRRRSFPYKPTVVGQVVEEQEALDEDLSSALQEAGLHAEFLTLPTRATSFGVGKSYDLLRTLLRSRSAGYKQLFASAAGELLRQSKLNIDTVKKLEKRYTYEERGKGLSALNAALAKRTRTEHAIPLSYLARSKNSVELDKYVTLALKEGKDRFEKIQELVERTVKQGHSLDEAVVEIRKSYDTAPF